ncbi:MAG: type II toxin-antitoxin system death-on-curing family toxin [Planctomycetota bacterium JB042]
MIRYLTVAEVLFLHDRQLALFGGRRGVRDAGGLDAALAQPRMHVFGHETHETLVAKAAAYLFHLAMNHPFVDGNKRTALNAALLFLSLNGVRVIVDPDDATEFVLRVASGEVAKEEMATELERWIESE